MGIIVEKEIDGVTYKAQFLGMGFAIDNDLLGKNVTKISSEKLSEILLKNILISPKVTIDDFDDIDSYIRVKDFLLDVARGIVSDKRYTQSQLKRKVKDNWSLWSLITLEKFDFQTVFGKPYMTFQDIQEANIAVEIQEEINKKSK